jgi:hypothetical protein
VNLYRVAADLVLILHTAVIVFILFGLVAVLLGVALRWEWIRNFYFRVAHLLAIAYVVAQTFLGVACPLTILENDLRVRAGQDPYAGAGFIQFWLHRLIFFDAEPWVFTLCYALFGLAVAATMWLAPPRRPGWRRGPARDEGALEPNVPSG